MRDKLYFGFSGYAGVEPFFKLTWIMDNMFIYGSILEENEAKCILDLECESKCAIGKC